jgi:lactate permease
MFLIALIPVIFIWRENNIKIFKMSKHALKRTVEPFLIIVAMSTMVQLMINSGNNLTGLPSSLEIIAKGFEVKALPMLAPFVGMFGAAITGSATISNIMFGSLLNTASRVMNMNSSVILALELVGAAAGNMIALADVIVAEAAVGLKNQTRNVLKGVIIPCIIYVSIVGVIGFIVSNYF